MKTDFEPGGAGSLVDYIKRDRGTRVPVRDHLGRELGDGGLQRFVDVSKKYGIERHVVVAPDPNADYTVEEVHANVRTVMDEWRSDRPTVRYVYAVHDSSGPPHAHIAMTGREYHLRMDRRDLQSFRETAREAFKEPERLAQREPEREAEATATRELTKTAERLATGREPGPDQAAQQTGKLADPERDREAEPEIDRETSPERGANR